MTTYEMPANARERMLRLNIEEARGNLQELDISNCIVANPEDLLWYISGLQTLHTLKSLACPLSASFLLDSLLRSLENVIHLEFSLVDSREDAEEQLMKVRHIAHVANARRNRETKLRKVFVEVAGEENMQVLSAFLMYCPHVTDLHIHMVHITRSDVDVASCVRTVEGLRSLKVFTLTCEALLPTRPEPVWSLDLQYCAGIYGNVVFRKRNNWLNYALLRDLFRTSIAVLPGEPIVLVAFDTPDLEVWLDEAASQYDWSDLQSLCIALFSQNYDETVYPVVGAAYDAVLRDFFAKFSNLTELNVGSFHFGDGIDFTELLSTSALRRLRALCLPPCGMRQNCAVSRLAVTIGDIEDLDIRLNVGGRHQTCDSCSKQLLIQTAYASVFRVKTGHGRLTLCNVPNLASLDFLRNCHVAHLRYVDIDDKPRFDYMSLAKALCADVHVSLRSLVVKFGNIDFYDANFTTSLCTAVFLERLCLLSDTRLPPRFAEEMIKGMAIQLPSISYLHIHYVDEVGKEARLTWIRVLDDSAGKSQREQVIAGKPCIMCSTQTFIALSKPRRREL
ncbi:uncharacterized protein LOC125941540 [Dermacentor silvarum]|uniref:uncharacterized protein LOC125941540 n=1 Tax=Dermacentor silvarum TaxID=543639 RepID=UPI002101027D|nr:uncharacterized protein LOC125941540 [Dermacentor silvarum]